MAAPGAMYIAMWFTKEQFREVFVEATEESHRWEGNEAKCNKADEIWRRTFDLCYDLDWKRVKRVGNSNRWVLCFHMQV